MRVSASTTLLLATAALAAPAPTTGLYARGTVALEPTTFDQGDGFYTAVFDDAGVANVTYTPFTEVDLAAPASAPQVEARSTANIGKRDTTCSGAVSFDTPSLDAANRQAANNANNREYQYGAWGWVHKAQETSFFCNYDKNYLTYQLLIEMQTHTSRMCGGSQYYGYDHRRNGGGAKDLTVGRTWRGDHFCDGRTHSK